MIACYQFNRWPEVASGAIVGHSRLRGAGQGMAPKRTRDFLIRGMPIELADKVKIAAAMHRLSMQAYIQTILDEHVKELEKRGVTLSLPKTKS